MVESIPLSYSGRVRLVVRWKVIEILWLHFLSYWKHKTASCMGLKTARTLGRIYQSPVFCCCYLSSIFNPSHSHSQSSHEHTGTEQPHPCDLTLSLYLGVPQNQNYRGETVKETRAFHPCTCYHNCPAALAAPHKKARCHCWK